MTLKVPQNECYKFAGSSPVWKKWNLALLLNKFLRIPLAMVKIFLKNMYIEINKYL